jgi:hypothetical protein
MTQRGKNKNKIKRQNKTKPNKTKKPKPKKKKNKQTNKNKARTSDRLCDGLGVDVVHGALELATCLEHEGTHALQNLFVAR